MISGMSEREFTAADLDKPQFTRPQAARITGLTDGQLKGILDRKLVQLATHNPGSGRSRLFSIADLIEVAVAKTMVGIGVSMRALADCTEDVDTSVRNLFGRGRPVVVDSWKEDLPTGGSHLHLYPPAGRHRKWQIKRGFLDDPDKEPGSTPWAYVVLDIDGLVLGTLRNVAIFFDKQQCSGGR